MKRWFALSFVILFAGLVSLSQAQLPLTGAGKGAPSSAPSAMSLVLTGASSQYLSRTWGASATDNKKATISYFIKRASTGSQQLVYDGGAWNTGGLSGIILRASDKIASDLDDGGLVSFFESSDTITDTTTWHNLCVSYDSTQATGTNRVKIYLDGVEVSYSTQTPIISQNGSWHLTDSGISSVIGRLDEFTTQYLDAKLAYFYLIDGQALTPSSFTTGTGSGSTHPATYAGTYGTNGFFLNFSGSNTNDQSGNANNWTQNGSPTFSSDIPM